MTKAKLKSYRSMCRELKQITQRIEALRSNARYAKCIRQDGQRERGTKIPPQQIYMESLDELEQTYIKKATELTKAEHEIEAAIGQLPSNLATLIRERYLCGSSWHKVERVLNISKATSMRWHNEAIKILESQKDDTP